MSETIVTVAGDVFFQPILDLSGRLLKVSNGRAVAGRVRHRENGYSQSIVLLFVVALESYVGRVSYLQGKLPIEGKQKSKNTSVPDYLSELRKTFSLHKSLTEVFVLRDTIAHGHIWELEVSNHKLHGQILRQANLIPGYGDNKYRVRINPNTRRSSICGLNLVPSAVGIKDVYKVCDLVFRTFQFLIKHKLLEEAALNYTGRLNGKPFSFWSLRNELKTNL